MPHRKSHSIREPKVSMESVPEGMHPDMKRRAAYGGASAKHGSRAAHVRGEQVRSSIHMAPSPKSTGPLMATHSGASARHGQAPGATSMMGSLGIIESPRKGRDHNLGIPGIISSTSLGPEQRQRLVGGIIESPMVGGAHASGPVHTVQGHDSTAYNAGMIHIRGSHFK
jgi:hypothetical protein